MQKITVDYTPKTRSRRRRPTLRRALASYDKTVLSTIDGEALVTELSTVSASFPIHYFVWRYGLSGSAIKVRLKRLQIRHTTPPPSNRRTTRWQVSWQRHAARNEYVAAFKKEFDDAFTALQEETVKRHRRGRRAPYPPKRCRRCGRELYACKQLFRRGRRFRGGKIERYWYPDCLLCEKDKRRFNCSEAELPFSRLKQAERLSGFAHQLAQAFPLLFSQVSPIKVLRRTAFFRQMAEGVDSAKEIREIGEQFIELYRNSDLNLILHWLEDMHFQSEPVLRTCLWDLDDDLRTTKGALYAHGELNALGRKLVLHLFRSFRLTIYAIHLLAVSGADRTVDLSEFSGG